MLRFVCLVLCAMLVTSLANFNSTSCTLGQEGANNQGCSTSVTQGLTSQILSELTAMGLTFKEIDNEFIQCNVPCVNQLQAAAADALASAASAKGEVLVLNSATRSSAQQYLLYQWYLGGICGIGLAAKPGTSNHEGGRAVDTSAYNEWITTLDEYGWEHTYPDSDPVHFDYVAAQDLSQQNLVAFQRLANRYTGAHLVEDGLYGPATEAALAAAPCDGYTE